MEQIPNDPKEVNNNEDVLDLEKEIELGEGASQEDTKKAIDTLTAQKNHWKKKFEEASKPKDKPEEKKEEKKEEKNPKDKKENTLSTEDLYALMESKVPKEDIKEVKDYADLKGITVAEALQSNVVKTILAEKLEERKVADATNTDDTTTTKNGVSDDELLANAKKGIMPESDEDMDRLAKLRLGINKK